MNYIKQQFLDCVKLLQKSQTLDIERAKMQLALVLFDEDKNGIGSSSDHVDVRRNNTIDLLVKEGISRSDIHPPNKDDGIQQQTRIIFQSDPSLYRKIEIIARDTSVRGRLEIIQQCITAGEGGAGLAAGPPYGSRTVRN